MITLALRLYQSPSDISQNNNLQNYHPLNAKLVSQTSSRAFRHIQTCLICVSCLSHFLDLTITCPETHLTQTHTHSPYPTIWIHLSPVLTQWTHTNSLSPAYLIPITTILFSQKCKPQDTYPSHFTSDNTSCTGTNMPVLQLTTHTFTRRKWYCTRSRIKWKSIKAFLYYLIEYHQCAFQNLSKLENIQFILKKLYTIWKCDQWPDLCIEFLKLKKKLRNKTFPLILLR